MDKKKFNNITKPRKMLFGANSFLLVILILSLGISQVALAKTNENLGVNDFLDQIQTSLSGKTKTGSLSGVELSGDVMQDVIKLVISEGTPKIYGEEIGVSFNEVQPAINTMIKFDPTSGSDGITLTDENLTRYISVGLKISCEYCCSAKSIINQDGMAACGCAHSKAMRGLLAYLVQNHGSEYSDDELLRELARWKGLFFPKQMIGKLAEQIQGSEYTPDTASLLLGVELPDYGEGNNKAPIPSDIENLPSMVGGC